MAASRRPTAWAGWGAFAGVMMILFGSLDAIEGLVGLFKDDYFLVTKDHLLIGDYTVWGWVHLILGLVVAFAGAALLTGKAWGRVVGVICAFVNVLTHIATLSAYPLWSAITITLSVVVIYALVVHGHEMDDYSMAGGPGVGSGEVDYDQMPRPR